jgi:hypothetical protein
VSFAVQPIRHIESIAPPCDAMSTCSRHYV